MTRKDMAWVRQHMAENPFEPMVALMGSRMYDYGFSAISWLRHYPDVSVADEFGVDRIEALL